MELGQHVGGAGQHAHRRAPAGGGIGGTEPGPNAQGFAVVGAGGLQPQRRLGDDQPEVVLHAVLQPAAPVAGLIPVRRHRVNPDLPVHHLYWKGAHVVGEGVEGAPAGKFKPGVVPVAGKNAVLHAAPVQGKPHVGTAVVHRVHLPVVAEDGDGVSTAGNHGAPLFLELVQGSCVDVSIGR